ncbi:SDR family NAD(P)-dependent oxidoreductase [Georgfuchsia toluolica]|nr:SDR family NAD(P)-dependent oxidoreductase [Georgfuchsia toluolica]
MKGKQFYGKIAVITGGTTGIGAATAQLLVEEGARVVICARKEPAVDSWAHKISADSMIFQKCDVAIRTEVEAVIEKAADAFGGLDILINNAGLPCLGFTPDLDPETWAQTIAVNLNAVFYACRAAIPLMKRRHGGAIVNTSSISGLAADYGFTAYNAAKGAVNNYTKSLAIDHAKDNIRANAVCVGYVDTPMSAFIIEAGLSKTWVDNVPMGRAGRPEEIANVLAFLASDAASFMTGSIVVADGGLMAATGQPNLPKLVAQMQSKS